MVRQLGKFRLGSPTLSLNAMNEWLFKALYKRSLGKIFKGAYKLEFETKRQNLLAAIQG